MVTQTMWNHINSIYSWLPPYLFIIDQNLKSFNKNPKSFNLAMMLYSLIIAILGAPVLLCIVYRLQYTSMSLSLYSLHAFLLFFLVTAALLGGISATLIAWNNGYYYILYNTISYAEQNTFGKTIIIRIIHLIIISSTMKLINLILLSYHSKTPQKFYPSENKSRWISP